MKKINLAAFIPSLFFLILFIPFWGQPPALDPMINFRESTQLFSGGFREIISFGVRLHPPLLYGLIASSFHIFGESISSYNLLGFLLFLATSLFFFFASRRIFGSKFSVFATILIFLNPLVTQNYFNLVSEALILSGIIFSLFLYLERKWFFLSLSLLSLTLMKETALSIVFSFFMIGAIELVRSKNKTKDFVNLLVLFSPSLIAFLTWNQYLKSIGSTEWRDTTFVKDGKGSFETVVENITKIRIFNEFLSGNLKNALLFNFQWLFTISLGLIVFVKKEVFKSTGLWTVLLLGAIYTLLVLSFPTWTIPRYSIPLVFCLLFLVSFLLSRFKYEKISKIIFLGLVTVSVLGTVSSLDPLSSRQGKYTIYNEEFYQREFWNHGPDGIEYNMQYLRPVKKQNELIAIAANHHVNYLVTDCYLLKLGERVWSMTIHNNFYPLKLPPGFECINFFELDKIENKEKLTGKVIFVPESQKNLVIQNLDQNKITVSRIISE